MKRQYTLILLIISQLIFSQTGTSTEVGITEGQLSVSLTGAATYSIPIAVPPGINGVVPQVGLVYNSQAGNGQAGYGWNISGISAITRIPRTMFHDGVVGKVDLYIKDRFALDGQRLILKSGTSYGAVDAVYETEGYSNIKITTVGVSPLGLNYGPASFKVEYPDGSIAIYGITADSKSIATWSISYWENPQGIRISYSYNNTNNNLSIASINYGSTSGSTPINEVKFIYQTRDRPEQAYVGGQSIIIKTILSEIQVSSNGVGFRKYSLNTNTVDRGISYETLDSITETSGDGKKSYNPTTFTYGETANITPTSSAIPSGLTNTTSGNTATISGDFDGDGKMDFVAYPTIGTDAKKKFWLYKDINNSSGYMFPDEVASGAFNEIFPSTWLTSDNKIAPNQGIIAIQKIPYSYEININTYVSTTWGTGVMYSKKVLFPTILISSYGFYGNIVNAKKYLSGDFNGDGLTDIIAIDKRDPNNNYSNLVYFIDLDSRKTTNFFNQAGVLLNDFLDSDRIEATDINGDGKTEILHFTNGNLKVYTLNQNNQLTLLWVHSDANIVTNQSPIFGDYNGDGKMDFIIPESTGTFSYNYSKYMTKSKTDCLLKT